MRISAMPEYEKNRRLFLLDGIFQWIAHSFVGGSFLSGYLDAVGFPVALNGLLSAFPALCGIAQLIGPQLAMRMGDDKRFLVLLTALCRYAFSVMYLFGMLFRSGGVAAIAALLLFLSHTFQAMVTPTTNAWILAICPAESRGKFTGTRDSLGLAVTSAVTLGVGQMLDLFEASGSPLAGFAVLGAFLGVCATVDTVVLSKLDCLPMHGDAEPTPLRERLRLPFTSREFIPVLLVTGLYQVGMQIGTAYWGVYLVDAMGVSYGFISFFTFVNMIQRSLLSRVWGWVADRTSWKMVTAVAMLLISLTQFCCFMTTRENVFWLYPLAMIVNGFCFSAIFLCIMNIQYQYAPRENAATFIGVSNALNGVLGFVAVLLGSVLVGAVGEEGITLFERNFAPPTFLMGLSFVIILGGAVYTWVGLDTKCAKGPSEIFSKARQ